MHKICIFSIYWCVPVWAIFLMRAAIYGNQMTRITRAILAWSPAGFAGKQPHTLRIWFEFNWPLHPKRCLFWDELSLFLFFYLSDFHFHLHTAEWCLKLETMEIRYVVQAKAEVNICCWYPAGQGIEKVWRLPDLYHIDDSFSDFTCIVFAFNDLYLFQ